VPRMNTVAGARLENKLRNSRCFTGQRKSLADKA
jgi:hypothetical protein